MPKEKIKNMSKEDIIRRTQELEKEGKFNTHITLHENLKSKKVSPGHVYIRRSLAGFLSRIVSSIAVFLGGFFYNNFIFHLKIKGKQNLKNIKSAILTCNHVHAMDNCIVRKAASIPKLYITVAEFNNFTGFLGWLIRNGRVLHIPSNLPAMKNFHKAIAELLNKNKYVLFYPEGTLWWMYKKPRTLLRGAFNFAVKNKVPVIPMFITFTVKKKKGKVKKRAVLNILEPIYPDLTLPHNEAAEKLQEENYQSWVNKYEEFYGKKLEYLCGDLIKETQN